jgi:hypothetical protein
MAHVLLETLVELRVDKGYVPDVARQSIRDTVGKSLENYASALAAFLLAFCETYRVELESLRARFFALTVVELHSTLVMLESRVSPDAARRAWNCLSHFEHSLALRADGTLAKYLKKIFTVSKQPKYPFFFSISDLLNSVRERAREICVAGEQYKPFRSWVWNFNDNSGFRVNVPVSSWRATVSSLRSIAILLIRCSLVARTFDVASIVRFRFETVDGKEILWVKMTRKGQGFYEYEPVMSSHDPGRNRTHAT